MRVHAEIKYITDKGEHVYSHICPPDCDSHQMSNLEWRKFIHDLLNEWLDNSRGTGEFSIKGQVEK